MKHHRAPKNTENIFVYLKANKFSGFNQPKPASSKFFNNYLCVVARYADLKTRAEHVTMGITELGTELCAADLHGFNFSCYSRASKMLSCFSNVF